MSATKEEAEQVFRIVNGYYRTPIRFTACTDDADCTPYYTCGQYHRPGSFKTVKTPTAWYIGKKMVVNLHHVRNKNQGGDHELAFVLGHEINHQLTFPPQGVAYHVYFKIIRDNYSVSHMINAYRSHMDFIVNEAMYRDRAFVEHLNNNGLDLFKGAKSLYDSGGNHEPSRDSDIRSNILSYNYVSIWRETNKVRFDNFKPRPNYDYINNYCSEFLNADYKHWEADTWFEFTARTLVGTARMMS